MKMVRGTDAVLAHLHRGNGARARPRPGSRAQRHCHGQHRRSPCRRDAHGSERKANGNTFVGVTDERGVYRMAARAGVYRLTAELQGFRAISRRVAAARWGGCDREPADAGSDGSGDDHRQRNGIPGRHLDVEPGRQRRSAAGGGAAGGRAKLDGAGAAGAGSRTSSTNAAAPLPDRNNGEAREFQLNLDGQQISSELGTGISPGTARIPSRNSSSSRTGSTPPRADRPACR